MAELSITSLGKSFGDVRALDDVSIVAEEGKLLTLLGPSGCGKSTTLWSVAGLHTPDTGAISIGDRVVYDAASGTEVPPEERQCGVVFQSYAIWPHMSVADNVGYPLKLRKVAKQQRRERVEEVLALVELDDLGGRYPHELSGGQQQRVALARALAYQPRLLLLDEPFSNLDAKLRERARDWLRDLQQRVGITTVFVTHDQDEALSMSDRVVVMNAGRVAQIGTPEEVYRDPADGFVADFVGSINLVPGEIVGHDGADIDFVVDGTREAIRVRVDGDVRLGPGRLGIRPETISIVGDIDQPGTVRGTALERRFLGDHYRQTIGIGDARVAVQTHLASIPDHPVLRLPDICKVFPASEPTAESSTNPNSLETT
ncbi:MAG: ABC transporter ATP-binding protein [Acidimicrobiaceae bacterium]|nr:ABC transporter ATP-binding protein [Acidimicrobiaceae bacterium]